MSTNSDTARRGDLAFGTSFLTTMAVAVAPSFVAFGFLVWGSPNPRPVLASFIALIATAGAFVLGSKVWENQPEAHGFAFADLMVWHWVRREWAEEKLVRNARLLGYDRQGRFVGKVEISSERQLFAAREIGAALDAKSSYTLNHSKRVEKHARDVAAAIGLSEVETEQLATAAALHDIGNIRIPEHVIRKAGELTIEERSTIEGHVLLGAIMAFEAGGEEVVQGLRHHHERWDGKGYPNGLKGEEIPLFARIIGVAEAYDAMTSTRPYRQSLTQDQAVAVLREEGGTQFDPRVVDTFASTLPEPLQIIERFPMLAWAQRQIRELSILFRRVGGTAVSAAASTIAIALILGTALLKPDVFQSENDRPGGSRPDRRMITEGTAPSQNVAGRVALAAVSEGASEGVVVGEEFAAPDGVYDEAQVLGERIRIEGSEVGATDGHAGAGGHGTPGGNGGGHGGGNGTDTEPETDTPGGAGNNPDVIGGGSTGGGGSTPGGSTGGGTTNPDPSTDDGGKPGKGNGNGNGHTKDKDNGHGKPDGGGQGKDKDRDKDKPNAGGKDKDKGKDNTGGNGGSKGSGGGKPDGWVNSGQGGDKPDKTETGSSDNGKSDDKTNSGKGNDATPGSSATPGSTPSPGSDDNSKGPDKAEDGWAESGSKGKSDDTGNEGNGNEPGSETGNGSSGGGSPSDSGGGSSSSGGSSESDASGKSSDAPGQATDKSKDSDSSSSSSSGSSNSDTDKSDTAPGQEKDKAKDTDI